MGRRYGGYLLKAPKNMGGLPDVIPKELFHMKNNPLKRDHKKLQAPAWSSFTSHYPSTAVVNTWTWRVWRPWGPSKMRGSEIGTWCTIRLGNKHLVVSYHLCVLITVIDLDGGHLRPEKSRQGEEWAEGTAQSRVPLCLKLSVRSNNSRTQ